MSHINYIKCINHGIVFILTFVFGLFFGNFGFADGPHLSTINAPCGILEGFLGDVQILGSDKKELIDPKIRTPLPCGAWISINRGWAQIRHQNGPHVHLSGQTFAQLNDFRKEGDFKGDHLILYRGQIYAVAGDGEDEFRILSSTGRARVKRGKVVILFSPVESNMQLIALENYATLENRFEVSRKIKVQAGESSELNFRLMRVTPTPPKAVSVAALRPRLAQLRVLEGDQFEAIRAVVRRQNRQFASNLSIDEDGFEPEAPVADRKLASTSKAKSNYSRHPQDSSGPALREHWVTKLVGDKKSGEKLLFPNKLQNQLPNQLEDPSEKLNIKKKTEHDEEKKRLIEELSHIRTE
jgi:hypothetical protein